MEVPLRIKAIFDAIDADGNGVLSYDEVQSYAARVGAAGLTGAEQLLGRAFAERLDSDRDGFLSLKEFAAGYADFEGKLAQLHIGLKGKEVALGPAIEARAPMHPQPKRFSRACA